MYDNAEVIHLLDLCILSYQLHSQTLYWPMDPYYEQLSETRLQRSIRATMRSDEEKPRSAFMRQVHANASAAPTKYPDCQGLGCLKRNSPPNTNLDPTISNYDLINPWRPSVTRPTAETEGWILYDTPLEITKRISMVEMARYNPTMTFSLTLNQPLTLTSADILLAPIPNLQRPAALPPAGTDLLYCFEGGTGAILRTGAQPIWSMMGFVLARQDGASAVDPYDVYIVFRGSRSGTLRPRKSFNEMGNPDWVTDLDLGFGAGVMASDDTISECGRVSPGFGASLKTMLPTVMDCLADIHTKKNQKPPRTIYVTGHSLGAALATHFTSAVLLGQTYRPSATQTKMPPTIQKWPWSSMQLITFALPPVGNEIFHDAFNIAVSSRTFQLAGDIVTQRRRGYGVGRAYIIDPALRLAPGGARHEPINIRKFLVGELGNKRVQLNPALAAAQPWKTCATFRDVLAALQNTPVANDTATAILGPGLNVRLVQYLDVLEAIAPQNKKSYVSDLRGVVRQIDAGIRVNFSGPVTFGGLQNWSLDQVCQACPTFYNDAFKQFLGLCLFLSEASKRSITTAATTGINQAPFANLELR